LLVEEVLALQQFHDEQVLGVDDLHHFVGHAQSVQFRGGEL
jgi:hypothetical protein